MSTGTPEPDSASESKFESKPAPESSSNSEPKPNFAGLQVVHSANFPFILKELGISLFVTNYESGAFIILRADGDMLNTHLRVFDKPMGMCFAGDGQRLAIGTRMQLWQYHNVPTATPKLDPPDKHDACFLPIRSHVTGAIDIHEMAWGPPPTGNDERELWFVNTKFSCLCTLHPRCSFVPRWRPSFVSELAPEDRCHLNGLALVDGQPRFVTALGATDTPAGWRPGKANGGVLMDVKLGKRIVNGLSMPHSPRWHRNKLYLLESGDGSIGVAEIGAGRYRKIAEVPGFTRGLDFVGQYAFIGLSQVRESAMFSGIPITQRLEERSCGVWMINVDTGDTVAWVRFEHVFKEIFAVQVVPYRFPELINEDPILISASYVVPELALQDVPASMRG